MAYARGQGARTIGLTGMQASARLLAELCDLCVRVPLQQIEQIEDLQVIVHHAVSVSLRARIAAHFRAASIIELESPVGTPGLVNGIAAND
jgi:DNA-binding MurR/RpiR family transcriptional regulator